MDKSVIGQNHRPTFKEKAAQVVAHLAAEKRFNAHEEKPGNHARSGPAKDPSFSIPWDEVTAKAFEKAFPGQCVRAGMPNRERRAMHFAIGLIRAAKNNDIVLAYRYLCALNRATVQAPQSKSPS